MVITRLPMTRIDSLIHYGARDHLKEVLVYHSLIANISTIFKTFNCCDFSAPQTFSASNDGLYNEDPDNSGAAVFETLKFHDWIDQPAAYDELNFSFTSQTEPPPGNNSSIVPPSETTIMTEEGRGSQLNNIH